MMDKCLYKVTTQKTDAWSQKTPGPLYVVAVSKDEAKKLAARNLADGLSVKSTQKLGRQISGVIFSSAS